MGARKVERLGVLSELQADVFGVDFSWRSVLVSRLINSTPVTNLGRG